MPVEQQTDWYQSRPKGWPRHGFEKRLGAVLFGALVMFALRRQSGAPLTAAVAGQSSLSLLTAHKHDVVD